MTIRSAILVILLLSHATVVAQIPPAYEKTFSRSQIEALLPSERDPLLAWLDAARMSADREVECLATGHTHEALDELTATAHILHAGVDLPNLRREIARSCGVIRGYRYCGQELVEGRRGPNQVGHDLTHAHSMVYYAVQTSRHPHKDVYLAVDTIDLGGRQCVMYLWIGRQLSVQAAA